MVKIPREQDKREEARHQQHVAVNTSDSNYKESCSCCCKAKTKDHHALSSSAILLQKKMQRLQKKKNKQKRKEKNRYVNQLHSLRERKKERE